MTTTPRLTRALTVFHAWREDNNWWDGNEFYLDVDTAKKLERLAGTGAAR